MTTSLNLSLTLDLVLRTRERIEVTAQIFIRPGRSICLLSWPILLT